MTIKARGLGRGLDALLGDGKSKVEPSQRSFKMLPIEFLQRGKFQPRQDMNAEKLQELADSIREQGIVQPIIVRELGDERYEIIAGERRWRAAQLAQLDAVPVVIKDFDDQTAMAIALIENIQREDLNALEEAQALKRLGEEFGMTHQEIAKAVGKSRTTVSNLLRLNELTPAVMQLLAAGEIEMGHARALLALTGKNQLVAAKQVVAKAMSVREVEQYVRDFANPRVVKAAPEVDPDVIRLQERLSEKLGAKVAINHHPKGKGKLVISYTNLDELDGILKRIN
ncbi:MAG: ParB/RepB/Spo0J family partition protein [Methylococcales bacterium]|jgi:ParB family chromosome partitioning protein|nr:ParB/RepB/Spo0J family partition protein [Methylococcaceae bacterium]HIL41450.1 ParB/RepB/Spo0J family partition protein [Methylococcales bacterium]